jgi:hypothetical protein
VPILHHSKSPQARRALTDAAVRHKRGIAPNFWSNNRQHGQQYAPLMRQTHNTHVASPITQSVCSAYIAFNEQAIATTARNMAMANTFFRNAFQRFVAARELQANRYINGALMNLDDETLKNLGTTREELRRKGIRASAF